MVMFATTCLTFSWVVAVHDIEYEFQLATFIERKDDAGRTVGSTVSETGRTRDHRTRSRCIATSSRDHYSTWRETLLWPLLARTELLILPQREEDTIAEWRSLWLDSSRVMRIAYQQHGLLLSSFFDYLRDTKQILIDDLKIPNGAFDFIIRK